MRQAEELVSTWLSLTLGQRRVRSLAPLSRAAGKTGLLTLGSDGAPLLLPLCVGVTRVGRSPQEHYVVERSLLAGIIEGHQWIVRCADLDVEIRDYGSTNGSAVMRSESAIDDTSLSSLLARYREGDSRVGWLGWDGHSKHDGIAQLAVGDILVNAYRFFVIVHVTDDREPVKQ